MSCGCKLWDLLNRHNSTTSNFIYLPTWMLWYLRPKNMPQNIGETHGPPKRFMAGNRGLGKSGLWGCETNDLTDLDRPELVVTTWLSQILSNRFQQIKYHTKQLVGVCQVSETPVPVSLLQLNLQLSRNSESLGPKLSEKSHNESRFESKLEESLSHTEVRLRQPVHLNQVL